jgi:hypothetical protein
LVNKTVLFLKTGQRFLGRVKKSNFCNRGTFSKIDSSHYIATYMNRPITPDLLARYFSGDCTGGEEATVGAWLMESSAHAAQAEAWLDSAGWVNSKTIREVLDSRTEARDRVMKSITE